MIVLHDNFNIKLKDSTYIALGNFDGLHAGHIRLINKCVELAKKNNCKSMVNTFCNHPLTIIDNTRASKLIMDNEVKLEILRKSGIDIVNLASFSKEFMKISPEDFIINIKKCYNLIGIVVGFNYRFGYKNSGNTDLLKKMSIKHNFELFVEEPVKFKNEIISSTRIRKTIVEGNIEDANSMLLRPFAMSGKVTEGKKIGRSIGFPTANLQYNYDYVLPRKGVYFTIVEYNKTFFKGITNIGNNPTVGLNHLTVETHILDFNRNIYNESIKLFFINRIRNEIKFNSLDELSKQLQNDKEYANKKKIEI